MSEVRQVEWVEAPFALIGKSKFYPGDISTLEKSEVDQYIAAGWCKCVATGEIGERKAGHTTLNVEDSYLALQT